MILTIREMQPSETSLLKEMLYLAIYQPAGGPMLPKEIINEPEIQNYIDDFGNRPADLCLIAEINREIVGAVWVRILNGDIKGYGYIDDSTPEFAIAVKKDYQKKGIGTKLMREMIMCLKEKGYSKTSLSVSKENYAIKMYQKLNFRTISENQDDYLMVLIL